ncbi:7764_t:CDS:2, partial [Entrophospora sp. SA101]
MATPIGDLTGIAPLLANVEFYNGQVQPDEWYNGINAILSYPAVTQIDDAHKVAILKSKLGKKYADVPNQHAGNNIDTPARLYEWLCYKFQTETVRTQQVALQRLAYEKFLPNDMPETYETRIRPLIMGVANNDANALSFIMDHLPNELFTRMERANPTDINAFFTHLKNLWLKRRPSSFNYGNANSMNGTTFQPPQQIVQQPVFQPPQQIVQQPAFQPPQQIVQQPVFQPPESQPFQHNFRPKTEKAKYYEELKNYAEMGLEAEDNRVFEPMEIDYMIVNVANKIDQLERLSTTLNSSINLARSPRVSTRPIQHKCEICKKPGHTYRNCPIIKNMMVNNSKKKIGHVNFADGFQQGSDTEEIPDESAISDQEGYDGIEEDTFEEDPNLVNSTLLEEAISKILRNFQKSSTANDTSQQSEDTEDEEVIEDMEINLLMSRDIAERLGLKIDK